MKKLIYLLLVCIIISGCNSNATPKQKTYSGVLKQTVGTKGGVGYDSCLGSPYYYLKLSSGKEIKLDPYPSLIKNNTISFSELDKLLGKPITLAGNHIKNRAVSNENINDGLQHEVFPDDVKSISCDHIEITELKVLE